MMSLQIFSIPKITPPPRVLEAFPRSDLAVWLAGEPCRYDVNLADEWGEILGVHDVGVKELALGVIDTPIGPLRVFVDFAPADGLDSHPGKPHSEAADSGA